MEEIKIEDRLRAKIAAGSVNPRLMALEITRDEARALVQSIYDDVNTQYVAAMQEEYGDNIGLVPLYGLEVLDELHEFREALHTGVYEPIVEAVSPDVFGVPLRIKEDQEHVRSRIHRKSGVDTSSKRRDTEN